MFMFVPAGLGAAGGAPRPAKDCGLNNELIIIVLLAGGQINATENPLDKNATRDPR